MLLFFSKRSVTSTMVFIAYCAGNAAGPAFVYESEAPNYKSAAAAMMGGYAGKLVCHCLLGYYVGLVVFVTPEKPC